MPLKRGWHTLDVRRVLKIYLKHIESMRRLGALFISSHAKCQGLRNFKTSIVGQLCILKAYKALEILVLEGVRAPSM